MKFELTKTNSTNTIFSGEKYLILLVFTFILYLIDLQIIFYQKKRNTRKNWKIEEEQMKIKRISVIISTLTVSLLCDFNRDNLTWFCLNEIRTRNRWNDKNNFGLNPSTNEYAWMWAYVRNKILFTFFFKSRIQGRNEKWWPNSRNALMPINFA